MKKALVLVALLGLVVSPAMAAPSVEKAAKELVPVQKPSQEVSAVAKPPEGAMVVVPGGEFTMGSAAGDSDEQPEHKVHVDTFSMDVYEVTVGQYAAFLQAKGIELPSDWKTLNQSSNQKRPVANIDSTEASFYCKWVGKRLPTEAEWEKAARGTDGRTYPWGNEAPYWPRWGRLKQERVPMAFMTWPGMSGNGSVICTTITIIRSARRRIRQDRRRVGPGRSVAVRGTVILGRYAHRTGASFLQQTRGSTGSGARRVNGLWLLASSFARFIRICYFLQPVRFVEGRVARRRRGVGIPGSYPVVFLRREAL
jgi:hypothetical protein